MYRYKLHDHVYVIKDLHIQKGEIIARQHTNKLIVVEDRILGELTFITYTLMFHSESSAEIYHEEHCFETVGDLADEIGKSIPVEDDIREGLFTLPGEGVE